MTGRRPDLVRAMLLREAVATVDMDRDQTIDLSAPGEKMTQSNYAVAPGEYVTEWLEEHQVSASALAHRLGVRESYVVALLAGQIAVSAPLAGALSDLTGIPASSWLAWETQYQKDKERLANTIRRATLDEFDQS